MVIDRGRKSPRAWGDGILGTPVTNESFHCAGDLPDCNDKLTMMESGLVNSTENSLKRGAGISSGVTDLFALNKRNLLKIWSTSTVGGGAGAGRKVGRDV